MKIEAVTRFSVYGGSTVVVFRAGENSAKVALNDLATQRMVLTIRVRL